MTASPDRGSAPAPDESQIQAFMQERFVAMFLSQNRRAQLSLMAAATLVAAQWLQTQRSPLAVAWWLLALAVTVWRYLASERFVRDAHAAQQKRRIVGMLLLNGSMMSLPLLAFTQFSELERAALSIILLATASASVATTSGFQAVFLAFAAPMLLPLSLAWGWVAWQGDGSAAWGLSVLVAVYLVFLRSVGAQAHGVFEEACRFRHGQAQMVRELSRALDQASEANRAKTRFLAAASHDLRQPIHSINVLVAALGLRKLEAQSREIVDLLGSVNQTLSSQLDTLLDVSKLDAGVVQAELKVQSLAAIVRAHHATTVAVAQQRGLQLTLQVSGDPHVLTDAALLRRTLSNLTDNALKFTPAGGEVRLVVRQEPQSGQALVEVADNGIGIPPDEQERVFGEFYQVGNVERDRQQGLGLGLSIVRRLCLLLQVQLALQSQPGVGTTITLRMVRVPQADAAAAALPVRAPTPRGLRILVVDDEATVRHSMRLLLAELGCTVHLADSLAAAGRLAATHPVDVLLSDLRLRGGDSGLDVIAAVRALHPTVCAVLITGDTAPDRIREAQSADAHLLFKPVTLNDLTAVLPGG